MRRIFNISATLAVIALITVASIMQFHHHHSCCRELACSTALSIIEGDGHHHAEHQHGHTEHGINCTMHLSDFEISKSNDTSSSNISKDNFQPNIDIYVNEAEKVYTDSQNQSYAPLRSAPRIFAGYITAILLRGPPVA